MVRSMRPTPTPRVCATSANPDVAGPYYRVAGNVSTDGRMTFTDSNAYSGDNGRAVLLNSANGYYYTAGNDNNGTTATAANLVTATGAQTFPEPP